MTNDRCLFCMESRALLGAPAAWIPWRTAHRDFGINGGSAGAGLKSERECIDVHKCLTADNDAPVMCGRVDTPVLGFFGFPNSRRPSAALGWVDQRGMETWSSS